ncbi:MAG TPA: hypothetical protein VLC48_08690 [Gemmatimonadota bacterium]|nr:hypothetical protein [Gemmatimonadota bacterium]
MRISWLVVTGTLALAACQPESSGDAVSGGAESTLSDPSAAAPVTATEYTTSLQFLPLEPARTQALILQLANTATTSQLARRYQAWQLDRSTWRRILDVDSRELPVRAPWRVFPTDSMSITVNADGDPDDLVLKVGPTDYTLDLGSHLDAWEDRSGTWHEIREATWVERGERVAGIAVGHRFATPEPERPTLYGNYERVILRSDDGAVIVLFHTSEPDIYGQPFAWMYADGLTRRWTLLEERTVEVVNSSQLRRNVPIRLWFRIPEPDIRCELTALERQYNEFVAEEGPKPYNALYRVRGWIEFAGERRNVEGFLERGQV